MKAPRPRRTWAVIRDGEIYVIRSSRTGAREMADTYRPGSKCKWSICRVRVTPIRPKERRR